MKEKFFYCMIVNFLFFFKRHRNHAYLQVWIEVISIWDWTFSCSCYKVVRNSTNWHKKVSLIVDILSKSLPVLPKTKLLWNYTTEFHETCCVARISYIVVNIIRTFLFFNFYGSYALLNIDIYWKSSCMSLSSQLQ